MANTNGTKTKVAVLETQMKEFRDQNDKDHRVILDEVRSMKQDIRDFMGGCDKRYASILVERIVYISLGATGLTILGIILNWLFSYKLL